MNHEDKRLKSKKERCKVCGCEVTKETGYSFDGGLVCEECDQLNRDMMEELQGGLI